MVDLCAFQGPTSLPVMLVAYNILDGALCVSSGNVVVNDSSFAGNTAIWDYRTQGVPTKRVVRWSYRVEPLPLIAPSLLATLGVTNAEINYPSSSSLNRSIASGCIKFNEV